MRSLNRWTKAHPILAGLIAGAITAIGQVAAARFIWDEPLGSRWVGIVSWTLGVTALVAVVNYNRSRNDRD